MVPNEPGQINAEMSRGEIHTGQHVGKNNQIAREIVYFHEWKELNMNSNTLFSLFLRMKKRRADEWAGGAYEIYCAVWQTQGCVPKDIELTGARGLLPCYCGG